MKLTYKRFWIWEGMMALMPVMMSIFVVLVLAPDFIISNPTDRELFFVWEIAYLAGGLLSFRKKQDKGWTASAFACWIIVFPIVVILSFLWADIRIHDGFGGLAHFIISCISWGFSIIPLLLGVYLYKKYCPDA
ncbi:MAG: hypothetical protein J6C31_02810 [Prevotella sp.]|nr:hypothetical protein [Prevotella sp.]